LTHRNPPEELDVAAETDEGLQVMLNPFEPGFFDNPYEQYAQLREHDPVHFSPLEVWVLFRYDDCFQLLRDPSTSVDIQTELDLNSQDRRGRIEVFTELFPDREPRESRNMLFVDPPDHTRMRKLVAKVFTPRRVEELRPMVQRLVDDTLDGVADRGQMDLIRELAFPLPFVVISEMLGMPDADRDQLREWSGKMVKMLDPIISPDEAMAAMEAADNMFGHVGEVIEWKRKHPADDLLSAMITAEEDGDMLTTDELGDNVGLLFVAGHETTVNLIGNGALALLRNRGQLEAMQADPSLDANAVDELLRYDSPVQFSRRILTKPLTVGATTIEPGKFVMTCLGSANRDPDMFGADAAELNIRRPTASRLLSFGNGIHHCLGAALAKMEGQVALGTLVRRFPDLELQDSEAHWNGRIVLRGVNDLALSWSPAKAGAGSR
jgi:cytochrome P450